MLNLKSHKKLKLFFILIAFIVLIIYLSHSFMNMITKQEIEKLQVVNKPVTFAASFDIESGKPVTLKSETKPGLWEGSFTHYYSTYYPYGILNLGGNYPVIVCDDEHTHSRSLLMDKNWKVLWIQVYSCQNTELKFYGPFKTDLPIKYLHELSNYDKPEWLQKQEEKDRNYKPAYIPQ